MDGERDGDKRDEEVRDGRSIYCGAPRFCVCVCVCVCVFVCASTQCVSQSI